MYLFEFYTLLENREEFLKTKFAKPLAARLTSDKTSGIEVDGPGAETDHIFKMFWEGDPTKGKYTQWLLTQYINGNFRLEDLGNTLDDLQFFHEHKRHFPERDLGRYDVKTLGNAVMRLKPVVDDIAGGELTTKSNKAKEKEIKKNAKRVHEDDELLIITPGTEEAACYYGKGTRWCTAANKNNMFDYYNKSGPLYILFDKIHQRKYQLHLPSKQLMDESDSAVSLADMVDAFPVLLTVIPNMKQYFPYLLSDATEIEGMSDREVDEAMESFISDMTEADDVMYNMFDEVDLAPAATWLSMYTKLFEHGPVEPLLDQIARQFYASDLTDYTHNPEDIAYGTDEMVLYSYVFKKIIDMVAPRNDYPADGMTPNRLNQLYRDITEVYDAVLEDNHQFRS